jgi:hypothetical protein
MKINDLFRSLEIFRQYFDEDNEDRFEIDYDLSIAIDKTDRPLSPEDYKEIRHLGWYQQKGTFPFSSREEYDFRSYWLHSS